MIEWLPIVRSFSGWLPPHPIPSLALSELDKKCPSLNAQSHPPSPSTLTGLTGMARRRASFNRHPSTAPGPPPLFVSQHESLKRGLDWFRSSLNFYRVHMLFYLFTPCIVAAIFYASNGSDKIPFIDCIFMASPRARALALTHR